jgi:hypothetical protein
MNTKQKIALAIATIVGSIGASMMWTIDVKPLSYAISSWVNQWVNEWIKLIASQSDLFGFLVLVWVISVLGGVVFYFLNKVRGGWGN